tara:strand:+ start:2002 stop:2373 length:372 start_codon:yes stop_codon:yes gene_type:complete
MTWENFNLDEFACRHCGKNLISHNLVDKLQSLRTELGFPFVITSGFRCTEHPNEINKSKPGTHAMGLAVDILSHGEQAYQIVATAPKHGFTGIGVNQKGQGRFIHLDIAEVNHGKLRPTIWSY